MTTTSTTPRAVAWIVKDGVRTLPSPTIAGAQKLVAWYRETFPKSSWKVKLAEQKNPCARARSYARRNPALLVMSNPVRSTRAGTAGKAPSTDSAIVKNAMKKYEYFHMTPPNKVEQGNIPDGWPKVYITIGYARRFDWVDGSGREHSKRFSSGSVKLCTTSAMKDVFLFGNGLGVGSGKAIRVDYDVPPHSGRNKWAKRWWHPHDSHPRVDGHSSGKAVRIHGPKLKVNKRGIIG